MEQHSAEVVFNGDDVRIIAVKSLLLQHRNGSGYFHINGHLAAQYLIVKSGTQVSAFDVFGRAVDLNDVRELGGNLERWL